MHTSDPLVGQLLDGRYAIQRKLARGGMATVYLADDQRLTRTVAIKVMHEGLGDDQDFIGKFDREARAAARLSHPNVVSVFDQGVHNGRPYIVMEHVEGCTLRHMITREGSFSPERALDLLIPVTSAVAAAHESGLIHRDIKPENVLISDRGQIKVADFGLARAISAQTATATGMLIGTVSYIAPELVTHGKADPRCDVYALAVVLYEMLTGSKPHTGDNPIQVAYAHVHKAIPAPSSAVKTSWRESRNGIPPYLDAVVTTAAARRPADRPTDARVLLDHLRQAREALARGVMDDPALSERMRSTTLDPENHITEPVPSLRSPDEGERTPTLRFTPSTPVSPGFPEITDGMPYYDGPVESAPAQTRRRRRWPGLIALLLAVVLVGSGLWWVFAGQYTATPAMDQLNQSQAQDAAERAGLQISFGNEYSEDVPVGLVTRTEPGAGERIVHGGTVQAFLSKGPQRFNVPALRGLDLATASEALTKVSLKVGSVTEDYDDDVAAGQVIKASYEEGTPLKADTPVDLLLSKGPAPVTLGDWKGKSYSEAKKALTEQGLKVKKSESKNDPEIDKGDIISQDPAAGEVHRGDTVRFVVSKGPLMVEVPATRGYSLDRAREVLTKAGFKVQVNRLISFGFDLVQSTNPGAGTKAPEGSTITVNLV
ncbi:Stk1 family PASTA domain-containing Ser/Thr kinase [Micropruina sonneratiae]|uniref:Stk1 family PASTA domain-containing Ser/Thr kinase n=1 Tax=Micropruina sonneratiae TaxID=2986940 RepID=UPI002227FCD5|nr:Stk1 family PASTA domain-containing Ser/Thr kinase [Micropruina sp. KQZ13P-5]MCW3156865.1 Stk1 family PASTA domain-containing Ser/Thr kinase [Micropruina sp. KQZ13P-5]